MSCAQEVKCEWKKITREGEESSSIPLLVSSDEDEDEDDDDDDDDDDDSDEKLTGALLSTIIMFAKQPTYTSGPDLAKDS